MSKTNSEQHLTIIDYVVFIGMLALSAIIGIYHGFISKRKQNTTIEYLMGSKTMKPFPVAVSLTASHVSSLLVLAVAADVYSYGTQYWVIAISILIVNISLAIFFLPVFYELQALTIYSYLEKRFDRRLRTFACAMYTLNSILIMPLMVYAPALTLNQVSGLSVPFITSGICIICVFYTVIGGIRAVVWSDTLQFIIMILMLALFAVMGTYLVGGFGELFTIINSGGRLIVADIDPDPTLRQSFWIYLIGLTVLCSGVTPECVQRFQSISKYKEVIKCLIIFCVCHITIRILIVYCGAVIYGRYYTCDPVAIGKVQKFDQIFPYYVMDVARNFPGLPGVFVAGVFAAGLSSLSTSLNCLAGSIYSDFLKIFFPNTSDSTDSKIIKLIVLLIGIINFGMVFIVEKLGSLFSLGVAFNSITAGTLLGLFILGMGFPKANRHGAFCGATISLIVIALLTVGSQYYQLQGRIKHKTLPLRIDGCDHQRNSDWQIFTQQNKTVYVQNESYDKSGVPFLFQLTTMYYAPIGALIVLIVGYPVSLYTGGCAGLDDRLLSPIIRRYHYNIKRRKESDILKNFTVDDAI